MRVKMRDGLAGPSLVLKPGDVHDFPDAEALRLVTAGYAVPFIDHEIERAVREPVIETRAEPEISPHRFNKKKNRR